MKRFATIFAIVIWVTGLPVAVIRSFESWRGPNYGTRQRSARGMRTVWLGAVMAWALGAMALAYPLPSASAQSGKPVGYLLYRVASAPAPHPLKFKPPIVLEADANGGSAVIGLVYSSRCRLPFLPPPRDREEQVKFTWRFDKDIRFLQPEETVTVTMTAALVGNCGRDHYAQAHAGVIVPNIGRTLTGQEHQELEAMVTWLPDGETRVPASRGTGSVPFKLGHMKKKRAYFAVNLTAYSDFEAFGWQVVYMYDGVSASGSPAEVTIRNDTPGASSPTVARAPSLGRGTPPGVSPGGGAGAALEHGMNRPGGDYRGLDLPQPWPEKCRNACNAEPRCRSWTYVKPGVQSQWAKCWLKGTVPQPVRDPNCVSGVKAEGT